METDTQLLNSLSPNEGDGIQDIEDNGQNTDDVQVDLSKYVKKEDYENMQAFATKTRQNEIARTIKLVEKDGTELHSLDDAKLKDAVTKHYLGMSYAEASAVLGSNFTLSKSNGDEPKDDSNDNSNIGRQLKLLQFKEEQREIEAAIAEYASTNPSLFSSNASAMKDKIREELSNVSTSLPVNERIRRAAVVSIGNPIDRESLAYTMLNSGTGTTPNGVANIEDKKKTHINKLQDELRDFWKIPKK